MRQTGADMQSKYKGDFARRTGGEFRRVLRRGLTTYRDAETARVHRAARIAIRDVRGYGAAFTDGAFRAFHRSSHLDRVTALLRGAIGIDDVRDD